MCLTPGCVRAPWLNFEAGALASAVDGRLYTYLHGVKPEQLSGPLSAFQSTSSNEDDTRRLVASLAQESAPDGAIDEAVLRVRFERAWPDLATTLRHLDEVIVEAAVPGFAELFNTKTFTEPMRECPDLGWIARHERLARVDALLTDRPDEVVALGLPHLVRLYDDLRRQIDLYLMNVRSKLLTARPFAPAADGLLDIPKDVLEGARRRGCASTRSSNSCSIRSAPAMTMRCDLRPDLTSRVLIPGARTPLGGRTANVVRDLAHAR